MYYHFMSNSDILLTSSFHFKPVNYANNKCITISVYYWKYLKLKRKKNVKLKEFLSIDKDITRRRGEV